MVFPDALSLGLTLALAGLAFWLGIRLYTRRLSTLPAQQPSALPSTEPLEEQGEAMLVISSGKVIQANRGARDLFHLADGEQPNLERLARRIRPANGLYQVCADGKSTQLVLDGRLIDCSAYRLALQPAPLVVVSFREPEELSTQSNGNGAQTLQTFAALNQAMTSSLEVKPAVQAILQSVQKLVPADWLEITLWDAEEEVLVPYRMAGSDDGSTHVEIPVVRYRPGEGYSGKLAAERQSLLLPDLQSNGGGSITVDQAQMLLRAYLGVPLLVGSQLVGTLELASMTAGAFRENDLQLVNLVAGQAASALNNAMLYEAEQKRTSELSGLAQLSQAFGSARDPRTLFTRLVESILPLLKVEILGFLLYNENLRMLEGQAPFHGIPEQFMDMYRIPVAPGSPLERVLIAQDILSSSNAVEDRSWESLGLGPAARGASLHDTVLVPLSSGGRMLGYLQASNHTQPGQSFSQDELHLLKIVANQAAPVIDNLTLIQQQRQRAQRAEALRRIASLASSAANLEEILRFSLQELAHLLNADIGAIFLSDAAGGTLRFHPDSMFGSLEPLPDHLAQLNLEDPQFHFTVTGSQKALNTGNLSLEAAVIPYYQSIQSFWMVESVVAVPLVVRDEGIGELWLGSRESNFFDQGSQQVAVTAAGQLAGVVEQSYLVAQTDESLRRRVEQLSALTRITRELSGSLDLRYLLQLVYDESLLTTRADCGTIRLFDLSRPTPGGPRTRFFIGEQPSAELSDLENQAMEKGAPVNIPDFAQSGQRPPLEGICSALVLPIVYQKKQTGLLALYSRQTNRFDATAVEISQTLATQAAVVLGNALQYEEQAQQGEALKRELKTLDELFHVARATRPDMPLEQWLETLMQAFRSATPFRMVVISLCEPDSQLRRVCSAGLTPEDWTTLQERRQPWSAITTLLQPEFKVGSVYFIPADRQPQVPADMHTVTVLPEIEGLESDAWDARDFLLIPLLDAAGQPLGLISLDDPGDGRRPDWQTFQTLELLSLQASVMLQSSHYTSSLQSQLDKIKADTQRLEVEAGQSRVSIPQLLEHTEAQDDAIAQLERQVERVHHGLELTEQANRQTDRMSVLQTVATELMTRFDMQAVLVAEKTGLGVRLLDMNGTIPPSANPEALFGQRNPLRQVMQDAELLLVADLEAEPAWQNCALLRALETRSFIALSFKENAANTSGILVVSPDALPPFSEQDRQAFVQVASQISVSLQKLDLLTQARRRLKDMDILLEFSHNLGSFRPEDILKTLVESAMRILPAAQAGWAGLWDERNGQLVPLVAVGYNDCDNLTAIRYHAAGSSTPPEKIPLPLRGVTSEHPLTVQDIQFTRDYNLPAEDLLHYRRASGGRLPVSNLVTPVRLGDRNLGVLVLENFTAQAIFTPDDENLSLSLAQQTALALENARLLQSAEQRAAQLQALTQVSGAITSSLSSEELIASLLNQLASVLPYDTASLWLRQGNSLSVVAARGFEDDRSLLGVSVSVSDSQLFNEMAASGHPIYVPDVRKDERFPSIAEAERISWLGIPLLAKSELIGVIAVDKIEGDFYRPEHVQIATTFAGQAAVALENAHLFEESQRRAVELDQRSQRLGLLNRLSGDLSASLDINNILRLTCQELLNGLDVSRVGAVLLDDKGRFYLEEEMPLDADELPLLLPETPLFTRLFESHGIFNTSNAAAEEDLRDLYYEYLKRRSMRALLVVPLLCGNNLHGWLLLQSEQEYRFSLPEIELARTISNQAAAAIQNARLFAETRRLTQDLEVRVRERTSEVTREHRNSQTLLRVITELSASLDMSLVLNRTLAVLNEAVGAEQSLIMLIQDSSRVYSAGPDVIGLKGLAGKTSRVDKEISRAVVRRRAPVLVEDIWIENRWGPIEDTIMFRSVLAVPLILGEDVLGSLLLFHRKPIAFAEDLVQMVEAAARQISISISNADLFNLIRDQSEHLGGMLREQQIEASRSRAILEAVADGVLVTDSNNQIYLFNASAQRILDLTADQVLGKSLDQFSGLFGKAGISWMQTIHTWSEDTSSYTQGELYSERLELDNGRVVEVHLSPVILRSEFLGTVSIFRDITHEVQVDRLKSEFVANVSHELRTPMTSIKGYVDIMLMGAAGELDPRQVRFLEIVRSNTERLSVLVNDLLDVSQIESGRITLSLQPIKLREMAEDVISDFTRRSHDEGKPMNFVLDVPADLPRVNGDMERVRQIISNLISNGYNYTPENGQVTVRMRPGEKFVQVDIIDNGIGIAPNDQRRIFERFYRGEDTLVLATAGTGLGLAITKYLVEMHGGSIWFSSSGVRGEGCAFSITLPVYSLTLAG